MNEELIVMLDGILGTNIENLSSLDPGTKEYSDMVENLIKIYRLRIEDSKVATEYNKEIDEDQFRREQLERETQFHQEQLAQQRKEMWVKIGIAVAELIVPITFYNIWMNKGFKFEETGSITSWTFKDLIKCFKPTKR